MSNLGTRRQLIRVCVAAAAVLLFLYAGRNCFAEIHRIADARIPEVLAISMIHLATLWITGLTYKLGLEAYQEKISRKARCY